MTSPEISVLLPLYRPNEEYLEKQLVSICSQSQKNIELIVLPEDESSLAVFEKIQLNYQFPVRVLNTREKYGLIGNLNRAFQDLAESCEFIAFCDQDDVWDESKLETLQRALIENKAELVHSDLRVVNQSGVVIQDSCWRMEGRDWRSNDLPTTLLHNPVTGCSMMITKRLWIDGYPIPDFPNGFHDQWFALIAAVRNSIVAIDQPLLSYRIHRENVVGAKLGRNWMGSVLSPSETLRKVKASHSLKRLFLAELQKRSLVEGQGWTWAKLLRSKNQIPKGIQIYNLLGWLVSPFLRFL